jgi:hypothetical protein
VLSTSCRCWNGRGLYLRRLTGRDRRKQATESMLPRYWRDYPCSSESRVIWLMLPVAHRPKDRLLPRSPRRRQSVTSAICRLLRGSPVAAKDRLTPRNGLIGSQDVLFCRDPVRGKHRWKFENLPSKARLRSPALPLSRSGGKVPAGKICLRRPVPGQEGCRQSGEMVLNIRTSINRRVFFRDYSSKICSRVSVRLYRSRNLFQSCGGLRPGTRWLGCQAATPSSGPNSVPTDFIHTY